jgi:hypothetical protein
MMLLAFREARADQRGTASECPAPIISPTSATSRGRQFLFLQCQEFPKCAWRCIDPAFPVETDCAFLSHPAVRPLAAHILPRQSLLNELIPAQSRPIGTVTLASTSRFLVSD